MAVEISCVFAVYSEFSGESLIDLIACQKLFPSVTFPLPVHPLDHPHFYPIHSTGLPAPRMRCRLLTPEEQQTAAPLWLMKFDEPARRCPFDPKQGLGHKGETEQILSIETATGRYTLLIFTHRDFFYTPK